MYRIIIPKTLDVFLEIFKICVRYLKNCWTD